MDSTILLLIIFADGREKIISGVKGYGHYRENINVFWFEKNGRKSFVPISKCDISEAHLIMRMRLERCKL